MIRFTLLFLWAAWEQASATAPEAASTGAVASKAHLPIFVEPVPVTPAVTAVVFESAPGILRSGSDPGQPLWTCFQLHVNNETQTCTLKQDIHSDGDVDIVFDGHVIVNSPVTISAGGVVSINASGNITIYGGATLKATSDLTLNAANINAGNGSQFITSGGTFEAVATTKACGEVRLAQGATVTAGLGVSLIGPQLIIENKVGITSSNSITLTGVPATAAGETADTCASHISVLGGGVKLEAARLSFENKAGGINVSRGVLINATANGIVDVMASDIFVEVPVFAEHVTFQSTGNIVWTSPDTDMTAIVATPHVTIVADGGVQLGVGKEQWQAKALVVFARSIDVRAQSFRCHQKTTCQHQRSANTRCVAALANQTIEPGPDGGNVTFDFALVAQDSLVVSTAYIFAASMLLCSGGKAQLMDKVQLDARGRGCPAGHGFGRGESRDPRVGCGSGGGSHLGRGGAGSGSGQNHCAVAGVTYDHFVDTALLPTQGASGGGCGFPAARCPQGVDTQVPSPPSAGGGLIWLSATAWVFGKDVVLTVEGNPGTMLPYSEGMKPTTGAGAGGQVILDSTRITGNESFPVRISARGGNVLCGEATLSGAGGGGFVGLLVTRGLSTERAFVVDVRGGAVGTECTGSFDVDTMRLSLGGDGQAASLKLCDPGYAGLFCSACPIGTWSQQGSRCVSCNNKPPVSRYSKEAWANESCPYECPRDVPNVAGNPRCLGPLDYALSHLGGQKGLTTMMVCTLALLVFLLLRPRLQRHTQGWKALFIRLVGARSSEQHRSGGESSPDLRYLRGPRSRAVALCCGRRCAAPCLVSRFTKEQLPYHVCRLYLGGQNTRRSPWKLDAQVPSGIADWIEEDQWYDFLGQFAILASVPLTEAMVHRLFLVLHPPLARVYALNRRLVRAERLKNWLHQLSPTQCGQSGGLPFLRGDAAWQCQASSGRAHANIDDSIVLSAAHMGSVGRNSLTLRFGYDGGATLGYLDFLDFSRSPLDWAPADLRREALLLVAHGHGTFTEPYCLDVQDPQVQHAAQTALGATECCHLVAAFNRIARLLPAEELQTRETGPIFLHLRTEIGRCAAQFGLSGFVHVIVLRQPDMAFEERGCRPRMGSRLQTPPARSKADTEEAFCEDGSEMMATTPRGDHCHFDSLADLIESDSARHATNSAPSRTFSPCEHTRGGRRPTGQAPHVCTVPRLCLVLADCRRAPPPGHRNHQAHQLVSSGTFEVPEAIHVLATSWAAREHAAAGRERGGSLPCSHSQPASSAPLPLVLPPSWIQRSPDGVPHLTTSVPLSVDDPRRLALLPEPMPATVTLEFPLACPCQENWDLLQQLARGVHGPDILVANEESFVRGLRRAKQNCRLLWQAWANWFPPAVLSLIAVLWLADLLAFYLLSVMLIDMSFLAFTVWLLCPPLVQPLSLLLGPAFLLIEVPRVGRLWALFCKVGMVGPLGCAGVLFLRLQHTAWYFEFLELLGVCAVKFLLSACASAHVNNVETTADLACHAREETFAARVPRGSQPNPSEITSNAHTFVTGSAMDPGAWCSVLDSQISTQAAGTTTAREGDLDSSLLGEASFVERTASGSCDLREEAVVARRHRFVSLEAVVRGEDG